MFVRLNFVRPNIVSCRFIYCYFESPITKGKAQLSLGPTGHRNPYFPFMPACHHLRYTPLAWKTSPPISFFLTRPLVEPHWHFFNPLASENGHPISLNSTGKQRTSPHFWPSFIAIGKYSSEGDKREGLSTFERERNIQKRVNRKKKERDLTFKKRRTKRVGLEVTKRRGTRGERQSLAFKRMKENNQKEVRKVPAKALAKSDS